MRKLLGLLLLFASLATVGVTSAQTKNTSPPSTTADEPREDPTQRKFGSGSVTKTDHTKPPVKSFGSGTKPKHDPKPPPTKTFGSGDKPKPPPTDVGSPPKTGPPTKTFGSGDKTTHKDDAGNKPVNKTGFDNKAGAAQKKEESKSAFLKGKAPADTYTDPKGNTVKIDPKDQKIASLRNQLSEEKWRNREVRERTFYSTYYSRPVVVYHDPYNSFFWYWMLDRSIEQQAMWAYNHRYSMDAARYNELTSRNAELAARVRALEASGAARNPAYQPTGMSDADLMYDKSYVQAAYNPEPAPVHRQSGPVDAGPVLKVLLYIFLGLAIIALVVWLIFVKKW